jgi:hypothetical protein
MYVELPIHADWPTVKVATEFADTVAGVAPPVQAMPSTAAN